MLTQTGEHWEVDETDLLSSISPEVQILRVKPLWKIPHFFPFRSGFYGKIRNQLTKIFNYLCIPDRAVGWAIPARRVGLRFLRENPDISVIFSTSPPPSSHLLGYWLSRKTRKPWVADFRDAWADNPQLNRRKFSTRLRLFIEEQQERLVVNNAHKIIVASEPIKEALVRRYGDSLSPKISVITNGFDPDDFEGLAVQKEPEKFTIFYSGSLRGKLTAGPFFRALKNLIQRNPELEKAIKVKFFGQTRPEEESFVRQEGLSNLIQFHGYLSHHDILQQMASADLVLLIITIPAEEGGGQIFTGKIFEYIALSQPILAIVPPKGVAAKLIESENLGKVVDFRNIEGIEKAILEFYERYSAGTLKVEVSPSLLERFDRRILTAQLAEELKAAKQMAE